MLTWKTEDLEILSSSSWERLAEIDKRNAGAGKGETYYCRRLKDGRWQLVRQTVGTK